MSKSNIDPLTKHRTNWHYPGVAECDYTAHCIGELTGVGWAQNLVKKTKSLPELLQYFKDNADRIGQPDWIKKSLALGDLSPLLFEVRFAYDLQRLGIECEYEAETLGKSSVDFQFEATDKFLVELAYAQQSEQATKDTEFLPPGIRSVLFMDDRELHRIVSIGVGKVATKIDGEDRYEPCKFPLPSTGSSNSHVVIINSGAYCAGTALSSAERYQVVYGGEAFARIAQHDYELRHGPDGNLLAGLFDINKPGEEARLFRERIHVVGLINEDHFGEGEVLRQIHFYRNPFLERNQEALKAIQALQSNKQS